MSRTNRVTMFPHEWRASTTLSGVYALRMLGMFLVLPVFALYAATLPGAEKHQALVGVAMGIYGLTQALCQLPLGMASDKFGRKKVIYAGLIVFAAGSFVAAAADTLPMLVVARAVQGAGAVSAAVTALLADLTREEVRTQAMAMIGLSIGLTFSVSLVAAPLMADWIGVSGLFALTGILTLISIGVVAWLTPNPETSKLHEDAQAQPSRFGEVLKNPQLLGLDFGIFALHAAQMALFTALPFAMLELGLDKIQHWKVYLPATITGLIVMVPLIIIGETRNKLKQVFMLGIACIALAQIGLLFGLNSIWLITAYLMVYFIGFNVLEASLPSMVSKIAPTDLKGTAMGVYNTLQSVGLFVGGACGGLLFQHYGFGGVFAFCSALMLLWLAVAWLLPAPKPVKNISLRVPITWQGQESALHSALTDLAGVEAVSFSRDKQTVYIKALQKGFDQAAAEKIISGV
ncbi:putative MFS family arabinose efflux permease [Neisseria perflava]|uniref:MFS transporter n=1 Tax=Neisseria perflava TaxID=33053 RepID=UPI0020A01DED|nr:MFS transporter [Neisseria perflava]MCP1771840.1 putative MFS family arabinose efflux permease [Neisseria perflava]